MPGTVAVRDSKAPTGRHIRCAPAPWAAFAEALVRGRLTGS
ncbi:DUF397 domain-containing protein [Streptomyces oceani]